jgi:hypothetical protein
MPDGLHILDRYINKDGTGIVIEAMFEGEMLPLIKLNYEEVVDIENQIYKISEEMKEVADRHQVEKVYGEIDHGEEMELDKDFEDYLNEGESEDE